MKQLTEAEYMALQADSVHGIVGVIDVLCHAEKLVKRAAELGIVLTVEQRPTQPLRMGGYETVVLVRQARAAA